MFRKALIALFLFFCQISYAEAATYYTHPDGGDSTECLGTTDAPYDGSGNGEACAFEHPYWVLGVDPNCDITAGRAYSAGDTIIIKYDSSGYKMGLGAPNTHPGASAFPWDCHMLPILSGSDSSNKTKIYGSNHASCSAQSSATELYGVEDADYILNLIGSDNVDARCLHITDHSTCRFRSQLNDGDVCTESYPGQNFAEVGIKSSGSANIEMHNIWVTGMASEGASISTPTDWELTNVNLIGNAGINWNFNGTGASGTTDQATGTMTFTGGIVAFSGCTLEYPQTTSSYDGIILPDPRRCCSQDQGCAADGLGSESNQATWVFDGTKFIRNISDGLDLLYHDIDGGTGTVTVKNVKAMKNSGNQIKVGGNGAIYNTAVDADCNAFSGESYTWEYAGNCATWDGTNQSTCESGHAGCEWNSAASDCLNFSDHCRASGNAFSFAYQTGTDIYVEGITIVNTVNAEPFSLVARNIANCAAGNLLVIKNVVATTTNGLNWINVDSSCTNSTRTQTNSVIFGFTTNPAGSGNTYTDPGLDGTILGSDQDFLLPSADNGADESTTYQPSTDIFGYDREASWDRGAIEYGSTDGGEAPPASSRNTAVGRSTASGRNTASGRSTASGRTMVP